MATYADLALLPGSSLLSKAQNSNMKYKRRKFIVLFSLALIFAFITVGVYFLGTSPEFNQYRILRAYSTPSPDDVRSTRTILLWSSFFGDKRWSLPEDTLGPAFFRDSLHCGVYQCEVTNEHDFLPSVDMYDAIVFHTAEPFPLLHPVPKQRSPKQFYVFALMEPPGETKHVLRDEQNFYNLTMTYRLDSDILWPYNYVVDIKTGALIAPALNPPWRHPAVAWNDTISKPSWDNKTRTAAWFVSHCETLSQREKLANALQKYIDVDIFGKCGTLSCPYKAAQCDEMLDEKYYFYFSFENVLCTDYVTEKLYNAMERKLVPIVFGGADYKRILPPYSYIDAEAYDTVEALASYLKYLSAHPEEYMRYFWWRNYYKIGYYSPFCSLCEKLHSASYQQKTQTYLDIEKWWLGGSCRFKAKIKF